jgi:hypothetical protein
MRVTSYTFGIALGTLAAAGAAHGDVFDKYNYRFVDDQQTGGLWHFLEAVPRTGWADLFVHDDNTAGFRDRRDLRLRNDTAGVSVNGTTYYDALAAGTSTFLNTIISGGYINFFSDPTASAVAETIVTMPNFIQWNARHQLRHCRPGWRCPPAGPTIAAVSPPTATAGAVRRDASPR